MQHAVWYESASERFRFLHGLQVLVEFVAPDKLSPRSAETSCLVVGTRENTT